MRGFLLHPVVWVTCVLVPAAGCDRAPAPPPPAGDRVPSAITSTLQVPTATVRDGQVEVTVTVRNAAGVALADMDVRLTVTPSSVATVGLPSARTDASGVSRFTLSLLTFGEATLAADLAGGAAQLAATIPVTCGLQQLTTPYGYPVSSSSDLTITFATAAPGRAITDGVAPARVAVQAMWAYGAASPTYYQPIPGACFRVSVDRPDVVPLAAHGSAGADGTFEFLFVSSSAGRATVTVESETYGTVVVGVDGVPQWQKTTVDIEFVATPAWRRVGAAGPAPADVASVAITSSGALIAGADGRVWRSADGGTTWSIARGAGGAAPFDFDAKRIAPSVTAPGVVLALSSAGTLARSLDDGLTFEVLDAGAVTDLTVDPLGDRYLAWRAGSLLTTFDHGTTWTVGGVPAAAAATYGPSPSGGDLAVQLDAGDWLAVGWSSGARSSLWSGTPWTQVTGFPPLRTPTWYEFLMGAAADGFVQDELDPGHLLVSVSEMWKIGPGGYTRDRPCFESHDGAATWTALTSCWPRGARLQLHGASGLYAATDHVLLHLVDGAFREVDVGLPQGVRRLAFDPADPAMVYAATSSGIYVTTTSGE